MIINTDIELDATDIIEQASDKIVNIIEAAEFVRTADVEQTVESALADCPFIDRDDAIDVAQMVVRETATTEDEVERIVDRAIENHTWDLDDAEAERWAKNALASLPIEPSGRCALGRAFTDAVLTILGDVIEQRSERGTAMFGELAMNLACHALVEGGGSAEVAEAEVIMPVRKYGLRLRDEIDAIGNPIIVGPFDSHQAAQDWAVLTQRHGTHITIEIPVIVAPTEA